jgi:serine/threonine protein kinase
MTSIINIGDPFYPFGEDDPNPIGFHIYDMKAGGMGNVYLANQLDTYKDTGRRVAIKTLQDWCLEDPETANRFLREAEVWVKLGYHPNIVQAMMAFKYKERPYILLEFIDGTDLRSLIRNGPLPLWQCMMFAKQFCKGMIHANEKVPGFVHRDIKPENCLIDAEGDLKITDFGLVKAIDNPDGEWTTVTSGTPVTSSVFKTQTGQWGIGTYPYMAPEQFEDFNSADVRTDIYSFGIMFFEMLTGERPFKADQPEGWYPLHKGIEPPLACRVNERVPPLTSMFVSMCLAKNPEKRISDFKALYFLIISAQNPDSIKVAPGPPPKRETESPNALAAKARSLQNLGKFEDALEAINQAIALSAADWLFWHTKASILIDLAQFDQALLCFDRAIKFDPERIGSYENKVKVLQRLKRFEEALIAIDFAIDTFPDASELMVRRSSILDSLGRKEDAEESLFSALDNEPNNVGALFDMASQLQAKKDYSGALPYINRLIDLSESDSWKPSYNLDEVFLLKGKSHIGLGQMNEAQDSIERAYTLNSSNPNVLYIVGMMHLYPEYGVELDLKRGVSFIQNAADLGHPASIKWLEEYERNKQN